MSLEEENSLPPELVKKLLADFGKVRFTPVDRGSIVASLASSRENQWFRVKDRCNKVFLSDEQRDRVLEKLGGGGVAVYIEIRQLDLEEERKYFLVAGNQSKEITPTEIAQLATPGYEKITYEHL